MNEDYPYYQRQKCNPGILASGNYLRIMQIFKVVRWKGGVKNLSGVVADFRFFARYNFRNLIIKATILLLYWNMYKSLGGFPLTPK